MQTEQAVRFNYLTGTFRVKQLANRLMMSPNALLSILNKEGFSLSRGADIILEKEHIDALANHYKQALLALFKRLKSLVREGKRLDKLPAYMAYFRLFLDRQEDLDVSKVAFESWELDEMLVENAFYALIYCVKFRVDGGTKLSKRLRCKIVRLVNFRHIDNRRLLKTIIRPHLFFNYSCDDDADPNAIKLDGFGVARFVVGIEASVNQFIDSLRLSIYEKYYAFN